MLISCESVEGVVLILCVGLDMHNHNFAKGKILTEFRLQLPHLRLEELDPTLQLGLHSLVLSGHVCGRGIVDREMHILS